MQTKTLLARMMAFRPVSAEVGRVNALVEFLDAYLREAGVHTVVEDQDGRRILYAAARPARSVSVLLNAHLDVVPADDEMFELKEESGLLLGRGTHDCLGNSAVLAQALIRLNGRADVGVVFSTDEEIGGSTTRAMVEHGYGATRLVLVVDGSGYSLITAQKGVLVVKLTAQGRAAHSAEPWKGDNAIDRLVDGYQRVRALFPAVAPPDEWRSTMAATIVNAGTVHNKIPETAEMTLNIRYTESTTVNALLEQIRRASGLEAEPDMACLPVFCEQDDPELQALIRHMRDALGRDITIKRSNGATDARHFVGMGLPIGIIGIPGRDVHGANEAADAEGLKLYEDMLVEFLEGFAGDVAPEERR